MFLTIKKWSLVLIIGFILYSCNSELCNQQLTSYLKVNFYNRTTKLDSAVGSILVISLNSIVKDTLYNYIQNDSTILLPLSALNDTGSSAFAVSFDTIHYQAITITRNDSVIPIKIDTFYYRVRQDTLIAWYKRINSFKGYECGFVPEFKLDTIYLHGKSIKDSIVISQHQVSNNNEINYKIYLTPAHH